MDQLILQYLYRNTRFNEIMLVAVTTDFVSKFEHKREFQN